MTTSLSLRATLAAAALVFNQGCVGHTPCDTNADCPTDSVCNASACTRRSTPRAPAPSECGDRCQLGRTRCEFEPLASSLQRCEVGADGCSRWAVAQACAAGVCRDDARCDPYLAEDAPCGAAGVCGPDLTCASLASLGGAASPTCRRQCASTDQCRGGEVCVAGACVAASLCAGCDAGDERCGGGRPERCEPLASDCTRWTTAEACTAGDVCVNGACAGIVPAGGACGPAASCVAGLVCRDDTSRCVAVCASSAGCGAEGCHFTPASHGRGICAASESPRLDDRCSIELGTLSVPGDWDVGLGPPATRPPDPYVTISGDDFFFQTRAGRDTNTVSLVVTTPAVSFATLYSLTVTVWDDDSPFSAPDRVAAWRLVEQYAWDGAGRSFDFTLRSGEVTLTVAVRCESR